MEAGKLVVHLKGAKDIKGTEAFGLGPFIWSSW